MPASNEPTRLRDIARSMTRGACGPATMAISRDGQPQELKTERTAQPSAARRPDARTIVRATRFESCRPTWPILKLFFGAGGAGRLIHPIGAGTKGLIIDIRNYPSEFVVFALGSHFMERSTAFARFTVGDPANTGAFHWQGQPLTLEPAAPRYTGKLVILIDEISQSQAEYTTMAFRAAPNATVVGSTTAGADGNVSNIPLPGGLRSMISESACSIRIRNPRNALGSSLMSKRSRPWAGHPRRARRSARSRAAAHSRPRRPCGDD